MDYKQELDFYRREYFRVLDFVPVGIVVAHPVISQDSNDQDILLKVDYVNRFFSELTGYTLDELAHRWFKTLYPDLEYRYERQKALKRLISDLDSPFQETTNIHCKDDESRWFEVIYEGNKSKDLERNLLYVIFYPIDDFQRKLNELEIKSRLDFLTQLPNRRGLLEILPEKLGNFNQTQTSFVLVIGDIDNFKQINDQYGHSCGDFVIQKVAKILQKNLRDSDLIARWGGEEFLIIFPYTEINTVKSILDRIKIYLQETLLNWQDKTLSITITFGVAKNEENLSFRETYENADNALYRGKQSGRNCIVIC